jgi:hypothetical protein
VSLNADGFNCIRVLTCDEDYVVEGGSIIFTVDDNINITYIKDITDISILSVGFLTLVLSPVPAISLMYLVPTRLCTLPTILGIMLFKSLQLFWYEFISVQYQYYLY